MGRKWRCARCATPGAYAGLRCVALRGRWPDVPASHRDEAADTTPPFRPDCAVPPRGGSSFLLGAYSRANAARRRPVAAQPSTCHTSGQPPSPVDTHVAWSPGSLSTPGAIPVA